MGSEPRQVSSALRTIASRIDASRAPDPKLVIRDLRRVIASMSNLIDVQLEENHYNPDSVAWYAYFSQVPSEQDWQMAIDQAQGGPGPLNLIIPAPYGELEEVPGAATEHSGTLRYYLGEAG